MNATDLLALSPLIVLTVTSAVVMLAIAFHRDHRLTFGLTLAGLLLALASLAWSASYAPRPVTPLLILDDYAIYFSGLILLAGIVVTLLSYNYFQGYLGAEEYYLLLLLASLGAIVLVTSQHFASLFLGLEILSVSLYSLISYPSQQRTRIEAGIKYLILAGTTSAFLLFGIALIYAATGSLAFPSAAAEAGNSPFLETLLRIGMGMLIVGLGFELALVPFHWWTPDVYQGAPAPVTAFIATVSKGGMFALMLRFFTLVPLTDIPSLWQVFAGIAIASMLTGNLIALMQTNVKRILAYSSIAHLGYLLVAFLAFGRYGRFAVAFYLAAYFITTLTVFGVITVRSTHEREVEELDDYRGLFFQRPWLALFFSFGLLSLAGIPPTVGIIGKIFLAAAGVQSGLWLLLIVLVVGSIIGVFYYLRIAIAMFRRPEGEEARPFAMPSLLTSGTIILGVLFLLLVGFGLYPGPLMAVASRLVQGLGG